jgi:multimeric flavodoxin WrbA
MQKVQIFIGSPRKNGNTFTLVEKFEEGMDKKNFITEVSFLYDYNIYPCDDCRACKADEKECIISDDMNEIYRRIDDADILIFATPIYWFGPTAKTKLLIDRLRPYYANKKLEKKKAALILTAGSGESDCDLTIEMFKRSFLALGVEYIGSVTSEAYDIGESAKDELANTSIKQLLSQINYE